MCAVKDNEASWDPSRVSGASAVPELKKQKTCLNVDFSYKSLEIQPLKFSEANTLIHQ